MCLGDIAAQIAARDVHEDVDGKLTVLSADRRRTPCTLDSGDLAQGDSATTRKRDLNLLRDGIGILSQRCGIAQCYVVAFAPLDGLGDRLGPKRHGDYFLHVLNRQAVTRQPFAVWDNVEVIAADHPLGIGAGGAGNIAQHRLDLSRDGLHFC